MDKLGGEVDKYIDKLQDDIDIYLREIENESFDSIEYLELKINNYLISIKEDMIYEFYKHLQKEYYEIDVIEECKNRLSKKLENIDIKLVDDKYYKLKESFTQKIQDINKAIDISIDAKAEYDANIGNIGSIESIGNIVNSNYIEYKKVKLDNINKDYDKKINDFFKDVENLGIIKIDYFAIKKGLYKDLNTRISNPRILKRKYKRECDVIQEQINNQLLDRKKIDFFKLVNNTLQNVINILKEEINNVSAKGSNKEEEKYVENNYYNLEHKYDLFEESTSIIGAIKGSDDSEDTKTYKEKEEIKNILITTSLGRSISISIDDCKSNMNEVSFNRLMATINKLIR